MVKLEKAFASLAMSFFYVIYRTYSFVHTYMDNQQQLIIQWVINWWTNNW